MIFIDLFHPGSWEVKRLICCPFGNMGPFMVVAIIVRFPLPGHLSELIGQRVFD
jgi:hypothetical protein